MDKPLFNAFEPVALLFLSSPDNIPEWVWYTLSPRGIAAITSAGRRFSVTSGYLRQRQHFVGIAKKRSFATRFWLDADFRRWLVPFTLSKPEAPMPHRMLSWLLPVALHGAALMSKSIAGIDLKHLKAGNTRALLARPCFYCPVRVRGLLLACAGLGTMRTMLAQNRSLYKQYLADNRSDLLECYQ